MLLVVVLLLGAGAIGWMFTGRGSGLRSDYTLICVATGERFHFNRDQITEMPALNPKTKEKTLVVCEQINGQWRVVPHYAAAVERLGEKNKYVDPQTLAIKSTP